MADGESESLDSGNAQTAWSCLEVGMTNMEDKLKAKFQNTNRHHEIMIYSSFSDIDDKETRIKKLELKLEEVQSQLQKAQSELHELHQRQLIGEMSSDYTGIVQILCERRGPVIDDVYGDFLSLIGGFANENRVKVKELRNPCDVNTYIPLLIVCFYFTRIGADAKAAIKGLKDINKSMLLIFYPADYTSRLIPSEQRLTDPEFRKLNGITDFIYASWKTIQPTKENEKSFKKVKDFIIRTQLHRQLAPKRLFSFKLLAVLIGFALFSFWLLCKQPSVVDMSYWVKQIFRGLPLQLNSHLFVFL